MHLKLKYVFTDKDRHGNRRVYVRRHGRKVRMNAAPDTPAFLTAYTEAVESLRDLASRTTPEGGKTTPGTFGWLVARYLGSDVFLKLDPESQVTRRLILEHCCKETITPTSKETMAGCPLSVFGARHVKMLRDRKAGLPGAANNRKKYLGSMCSWAVEDGILKVNPCRDVKRVKYATSGFYTWTMADIRKYEERHPLGTMAHLAMSIMLRLGVRKGDAVKLGPRMVTGNEITFVPGKTTYVRRDLTTKPVLPKLTEAIAATPHGKDTFIATGRGHKFTEKGFGNWMRDRCDEAGLPECTSHGLRKIACTICAEEGASVNQMMALFDWSTPAQAMTYTKAADKKRMALESSRLIEGRTNVAPNI